MPSRPPEEELEPVIGEEEDSSGLASVIPVDRREDVATVCGRVDTAPTFAVVVHAPHGNRSLSTELGMRRLQRHADEAGKVLAIATRSRSLSTRARQLGIPVAPRPEYVRWESGGRRVLGVGGHSIVMPALGRYFQLAAIAVFVLAFAGLALTLAPSAHVVVVPPVETLSEQVVLIADPSAETIDLDTMTVPAGTVATTESLTLVVRTTGTMNVGVAPASVAVTLTNNGEEEITVEQGAELVAGEAGLRFQIAEEVTAPPGQPVVAPAVSVEPGAIYNVPAGMIWAWADGEYLPINATNAEPGTGGASEERAAVTDNDVLTINNLARDLANSTAVKRLLIDARPHDAVFIGTAEATVETGALSATAGATADMLLMEVRITISALAVLSPTLDEVAREVLRQGHGVGEFIPGSVVAIETGEGEVDAENGTVRTQVQLRGDFASGMTRDALKDAVKGKSESDARSILQNQYGIQNPDVRVSPSWAPWLPRFDFRIDVEMRSPDAEGPAPDDSESPDGQPSTGTTPTPGT